MSTRAIIVIEPRPVIRTLLICMALLIVAGLAVNFLTWSLGRDYLQQHHLHGLVREFDLDEEDNLPNWFSTICLFLCAIALAAIALEEWGRKGPLSTYWFVLAGTFVLLSLDEAASFHEMLIGPLRNTLHTGGFLYFAWVIPGGLFVLGYLLAFLRFLSKVPDETRRDFLVSGFVYCSGALVMEMVDGRYMSLHGPDLNYWLMTTLEESLEMAGAILFLRSLLAYLADHVGDLTVHIPRSTTNPTSETPAEQISHEYF